MLGKFGGGWKEAGSPLGRLACEAELTCWTPGGGAIPGAEDMPGGGPRPGGGAIPGAPLEPGKALKAGGGPYGLPGAPYGLYAMFAILARGVNPAQISCS